MKHYIATKEKGFAMLFTVLIMTLILSIALSVSNITYKQTVLSSLAKDSQTAFYEADAGVECALYYDLNVNQQWFDGIKSPQTPMPCGDQSLDLDASQTTTNYYVYKSSPSNKSCINSIIIDKTVTPVDIVARGNNICQTNPRQVERALEVKYNQ